MSSYLSLAQRACGQKVPASQRRNKNSQVLRAVLVMGMALVCSKSLILLSAFKEFLLPPHLDVDMASGSRFTT